MKQKLAKLIDVKSIVTLFLTAVFCVLALRRTISADQFITVFTVVISFYFGTEAIIVALITAASAVACQLVIASNSRKTMQQAQYDSQKLIEYKIDKLSERVDKHNSVIARTYMLEQDYALIDEKIKVANHRIEDLERK